MKDKLRFREYIFVASMLFGLFFGAGNLIFPVSMGQLAGNKAFVAALGFCLSGVGLPLLGIVAMGISQSRDLFGLCRRISKAFAYFFTTALYLTIGPLFAIPRTATVSFQVGVSPFSASPFALLLFSFIFFSIVLAFSLYPSRILTWVGKVLNPLFLLFLGVLIVVAFVSPMGSVGGVDSLGSYAEAPFFTGVLEGYNTMDALASLAFGIVLIDVITNLGIKEGRRASMCAVKAGLLSMALMAGIYISITLLGSQSVAAIGYKKDGGLALFYIAEHYFGSAGSIFLAFMITIACLKTAIGLITACSESFTMLFPRFCRYKPCALFFTIFSFVISNAGLSLIIKVSLPVLNFLYPLTIILILLTIAGSCFNDDKRVYRITLGFCGISALLEVILSLFSIASPLPLSSISMGWVIPSLIGFAFSLIYCRIKGPVSNTSE